MKTKGLWITAGLGLLMNPMVCRASSVLSAGTFQRHQMVAPVKDLPLYEIDSKSIPPATQHSYEKKVLDMAQHVFFQRTPHSLTLGARVAW